MATSHRTGWILFAAALVVAGCDSSSDDSDSGEPASSTTVSEVVQAGQPTTEAIVLESPDGVVRVEVPAGAVLEGTPLAIELVDPAEVPSLAGIVAIGSAYRLVPTEVTFPEPLLITYELPLAGIGRAGAVPLVYSVLERDGTALRAIEQRTEVAEAQLRHVSQIDRFGTFALLDGGVDLTLEPVRADEVARGESFEATLTVALSDGPVEPGYDIEVQWEASGALSTEPDEAEPVIGFGVGDPTSVTFAQDQACVADGAGTYVATLAVVLSSEAGDAAPDRQLLQLTGEATCGEVGR